MEAKAKLDNRPDSQSLRRTKGENSLAQLLPKDLMPVHSPKQQVQVTPRAERKAFEATRKLHRGKVIQEIVETEKSFLEQISLVNSLYRAAIEESSVLPKSIIANQLFPGLSGLIVLHTDLLKELEAALASVKRPHRAKIADIFLQFREFMKVHSDYAPKHAKASEAIMEHYDTNTEFKKLIDSIEQEPLYGLTGLNSLRQATVQRLPRYILLLSELIKKTSERSAEYQKLLEARESYASLANRVNSFLKQSSDNAKVLALDRRFSNGSRAALAPSQVMDKNSHRWKKRRGGPPILCAWCNTLLGTISARYCARCNIVVHSNCRGRVSEVCAEGTLMEQGRKFVSQFTAVHKSVFVGGRNEATKSKSQEANLVLFNDSLLIYYGKESEAQLVSLIRWFSRTKARKIQILDSSETSITVTSPRDGRNHFFYFDDKTAKDAFFGMLRNTSDNWLEEAKDQIAKATPIEEIETERAEVRVDSSSIRFTIEMTVPVQNFTAYIIQVEEEWHSSTIIKRYSEFHNLHKCLSIVYPKKALPKLPSKRRLRDSTSLHFVQKRCSGLQEYLNGIVQCFGIEKIPEFQQFIRTTLAPSGEAQPVPASEDKTRNDSSEESYGESEDEDSQTERNEDSQTDSTSLVASSSDLQISNDDVSQKDDTDTPADAVEFEVGCVLFSFCPGKQTQGLAVEKGEDVLILAKESLAWWYCRSSDNRSGYIPRNFIEVYDTKLPGSTPSS